MVAASEVTYGITVQATVAAPAAGAEQTAAGALAVHMATTEAFLRTLKPPFDTVWVEDHLQWGERPLIECWTALTWLAARLENLNFGNIVLGQSYRNPALTAKMASVVQMLTGGRLILGLGAGWKEDEYLAYGYDYPSGGVRVEQFAEACAVIKAMCASSPASFEGKHYRINNAYNEPQPEAAIPLLLGGQGAKSLRVCAQYADWWNAAFNTVEDFAAKLDSLRQQCAEIGRDFATIKLTYYGFLQITDDPAQIEQRPGLHMQAGNPQQVAAELQQFIDLGVSHFMFRLVGFPDTSSYDRLLAEVLPLLRLGADHLDCAPVANLLACPGWGNPANCCAVPPS